MIEMRGRSESTMPSEYRDGSMAPTCDGPCISDGADTLGGGQNSCAARADACTESLPRCATTLINVLPVPALCCADVATVVAPAMLSAFSDSVVGLSGGCPRGDCAADELFIDEVAPCAESSWRVDASSCKERSPSDENHPILNAGAL